MKYELNVELSNGNKIKEQFCNLDDVKRTKRAILCGEKDYKFTIKPLYLFY